MPCATFYKWASAGSLAAGLQLTGGLAQTAGLQLAVGLAQTAGLQLAAGLAQAVGLPSFYRIGYNGGSQRAA
jgi:hypothetical protein